MDSLEELAGRRVLVAGIGGGGDSLGALVFYHKLKALGARPLLGSVGWERLVVDPFPGPIPLEQLRNAEPISRAAALVTGESYADRYGYRVRPQIAVAAGLLGERAVFLDLSKGAEGLREAFEALGQLGVEAILGVDVGGDAVAIGCEEELWSPLADAISLAALRASSLRSLLIVLSPGADGELPSSLVLERIARVARRGGLVGTYGLARREHALLKDHLHLFASEASKIPFEAFAGAMGERKIRGGVRTVQLSPLSTVAFALEVSAVYEQSELARLAAGSRSVREARERLNSRCVYTELDLEEDLSSRQSERPVPIAELRREGRRRLLLAGCSPIIC
ncbi:MAG: DUF1152 domain-containing protein [Acidilobaceae archaeon]|nr:DUF1152 domain-containing protein [Acidilobaceae archaeon]